MLLRPPIATLTDTLCPYTTLFRSPVEAWLRSTRGVSCPIYVALLRPCPATTLRVVPLPVPGRIKGRHPKNREARPRGHAPPPLFLGNPLYRDASRIEPAFAAHWIVSPTIARMKQGWACAFRGGPRLGASGGEERRWDGGGIGRGGGGEGG